MPPNDVEAERNILGCLLIDSGTFAEVDGALQPADFYDNQNRIVFSAIDRLQVSGEPFDPGSVGIELRRCDQADEIGGLPYLNDLMESVPHAYHADTYARRVRDQSKLRQLMYAGQRIAAEAAEPGMTVEHVQERIDGIGELLDDNAASGKRFTTHNAAALASGDFRTEYHIPGILAEGMPAIIGGAFKTLKTSIAADLHFSLSTGAPFLGKFPVTRPYRTAFMSGESGLSALQSVFKRVARSRGWSLDRVENFVVTPDLPSLTDAADMRKLTKFVEREFEGGTECLIIDPIYLCMDMGDGAGNIFHAGKNILPLAQLAEKTGCTIILIHHLKKAAASIFDPAELGDLQWSGFAEFAAQWLLLSRRSKFEADSDGEHQLWLNCGGRAGHSNLMALDVTEGRQDSQEGRRWQVDVKPASQARAESVAAEQDAREANREMKQATATDRHRERIKDAFDKYPDGETKTVIRDTSGVDSKRFNPILAELLAEGHIESCEVTKANNHKYPGYRTTRIDSDAPGYPTVSDSQSTQSDKPPLGVSDRVVVGPSGDSPQDLSESSDFGGGF